MGKIAHIALLAVVVQSLLLMVTALNYRTDSSSSRHVSPYYKIKYLCGRKYNVWCPYPSYAHYYANACKCVCKGGLKWDSSAKRCVCPYPGQIYNAHWKKCACPSCQKWDSAAKRCVCPYPGQVYEARWNKCVCPNPLKFDKSSKRCVCPYPGQVFVAKEKKCVCPGDLELSMNKKCQCPPCRPYFTLVQKKDQCECVCNRKCSGLFVLDRKSCRCVCPEGLVFNAKTKKCVCPYEGQVYDPKKGCICPGDLVLNRDSRSCVCPKCPPYFRSVQKGNECKCVCDRKCTGLFVLDPKSCRCVCPEGLVFNAKTKKCVCPYEGQVYDPKKGCICPGDLVLNRDSRSCVCPKCPPYFRSVQKGNECKCVCDRICTGLFVLDPKSCRCVCPEGLMIDPKTQQCVCPYEGQVYDPKRGCVCPGHLILDRDSRSCVCPKCPPHFRSVQQGDECRCVCNRSCTGLLVLDPKSCQCVCPQGLVFNSTINQCVCPYEGQVYDPKRGCICPGDLVLNNTSRSCVCPTCDMGYTLTQDGDQCECVCNVKCVRPFVRASTCQCVCPEGTTFNPDTGNCDCPEGQFYDLETQTCVCNGDKILNNSTGECECSPCPHAGYTLQQKDNACKCVCTVICGEGLIRNEETCTCEEPTFTKPPIPCRCVSKEIHPLQSVGCSRLAVSREHCENPHDTYNCVYKC